MINSRFLKYEVMLGRLLLLILSIVLMLAIIDYGAKWLLPKSRSNVERDFRGGLRKPKPYVMFGGVPNGNYENEPLNSMGYRGKLPLLNKKSGEFRVFILGGSTVFFGKPTMAVMLESEFHKNGYKNVNVYNYGVISSVTGMELSRIVFEISEFNPDLIIMYGGGNDLGCPAYYDPRPGYPYNWMVYEYNPLIESDVETYPVLAMAAYGSRLFRYLFPTYFVDKFVPMQELRKEAKWGTKIWEDKIVENYIANIIKAHKVSRAFGADFVAFFQPLVYYKKPLSEQERNLIGPELADYEYMRGQILSNFNQLNDKSKIRAIDLSESLNGTFDTVFFDNIHLNQPYFEPVVKKIYGYVVKYVKKNDALNHQ